MVLVGLVSCTTFDDPTTENYGAGPSIDVTITPGAQTDSAFTITITPAAGAAYYAYVIDENDEAEQLDSATLFKGGYGNAVVKVADQPTTVIEIDDADPNTTYQVYAVAGSDKGIVGKITVKSITTTDARRPAPGDFAQNSELKAIQVAFSEAIARGAGAVTGKYYKEWDWENPVTVAAEEIEVQVKGNVIQLTAPNTPDGAYVTFAWEEGAFVDGKGNKCAAFTTTYNEEEDDFEGYWVQNKQVAFAIADAYVTAPENGALIGNIDDFKGQITFPFNIYRNEEFVEKGDLSVTFTSANKKATYNLDASDWSVEDNVLSFVLPASVQAEGGDIITVNVVDGAISDEYGNPNEAFSSKTKWKFFAMTKDMALGTFNLGITYNGAAIDLGNFTIVDAATEENPTGLLFKDFYLEGSELEGFYDLKAGKVYIQDGQVVGMYTNSKGTTYGLVFYNAENQTDDLVPVPFTVNADGTMTADAVWGIYAFTEDFSSALGWFEVAHTCTFKPVAAARALKNVAKVRKANKAIKLSKAARSLKKHVSK